MVTTAALGFTVVLMFQLLVAAASKRNANDVAGGCDGTTAWHCVGASSAMGSF